jgi:uncharacterized membrane protein YccC
LVNSTTHASSADLALARRLEETALAAGQVRSLFRKGPARRERKRARRQLAKLIAVLNELQREALTDPPEDTESLLARLAKVDRRLHRARHELAGREDLRRFRLRIKKQRRKLAEHLPADEPDTEQD